jgi:hypothetical protein
MVAMSSRKFGIVADCPIVESGNAQVGSAAWPGPRS